MLPSINMLYGSVCVGIVLVVQCQQHGGENVAHMQQDPNTVQVNEGRDWRKESHNAEHILEHLDGIMNKSTDEMTEQELQFYYFKLHDYDSNHKLDGLELTKAITHFHDGESDTVHNVKTFSDADITGIVDVILKDDDLNDDGYIEYVEFVTAQNKQQPPPPDNGSPPAPQG